MNADGSLADAPLMFVFLDISSLPHHRRFLEDTLRLRVVENQFHPPHEHHGLVKYDAGGTILSINLFADRKFRSAASDAVTLVCRTSADLPETLTDVDGHHYELLREPPADAALVTDIVAVRLAVTDLAESVRFYRDVLGLSPSGPEPQGYRFRTGSLDLVLYESTVDPDLVRYNACLLVFYTSDCEAAEQALIRRGLRFRSTTGVSDIGATARFNDPSGHVYCLYQPSAESLQWGSAAKVMDLMTGGARIHH
ncbi:MAG TPA: VOC family protein [Rugosimonospora sp.]|nr:VOC family protein [Rugosimonospora sp.]